METFRDEIMADLLNSSLETATIDANGWRDTGEGPGAPEGRHINWLTIADDAASAVEDVKRIKAHPLVPYDIPVYGHIDDCKTGNRSRCQRRPPPKGPVPRRSLHRRAGSVSGTR